MCCAAPAPSAVARSNAPITVRLNLSDKSEMERVQFAVTQLYAEPEPNLLQADPATSSTQRLLGGAGAEAGAGAGAEAWMTTHQRDFQAQPVIDRVR